MVMMVSTMHLVAGKVTPGVGFVECHASSHWQDNPGDGIGFRF